jgi:hypothetical protein
MKHRLPVAVVYLAVGVELSCGLELPHHEDFAVGMSRDDIRARFGEPARTQELAKSDERIWGPIEDFWPEVPVGATVEIWGFRSTMSVESDRGSRAEAGQTELYFVNDSNTVDGIGFYIEGAVYESN